MIPQARGWKAKVKHIFMDFSPAVRYAILKLNVFPNHSTCESRMVSQIGGWGCEVQADPQEETT